MLRMISGRIYDVNVYVDSQFETEPFFEPYIKSEVKLKRMKAINKNLWTPIFSIILYLKRFCEVREKCLKEIKLKDICIKSDGIEDWRKISSLVALWCICQLTYTQHPTRSYEMLWAVTTMTTMIKSKMVSDEILFSGDFYDKYYYYD